MIDAGFGYWAETNRFVLDHLPTERAVILRTSELSQSLLVLAKFVGVPPQTLVPHLSALNHGQKKYRLLQTVSDEVVAHAYQRHAEELMREFFPRVTPSTFLGARQQPVEVRACLVGARRNTGD